MPRKAATAKIRELFKDYRYGFYADVESFTILPREQGKEQYATLTIRFAKPEPATFSDTVVFANPDQTARLEKGATVHIRQFDEHLPSSADPGFPILLFP